MTRRGFMAATAATVATGAACAFASETPNQPETPAADATYGTQLNPQQEQDATTDYAALFSPLQIGGVTLKNRIMKSAAGSETQHDAHWPSDTSLAYYEQFAKGGAGAVCFESSNIFPTMGADAGLPGAPEGGDVPAGMVSLDISTDDGIAAHKAIADFMHGYGTVVIGQVYDMMMATGASSSFTPSSALETSFSNGHMQTTEEVQAEIAQFIDGIERYYKAGFDGVEINASCNHYFSTYLSRYINRERTDQYGGQSIENRARVLTEIISGVRERIQDDGFIIQVLFSGVEGSVDELGADEGFTTIEEACEFAKLFEAAGASSLHVRSEAYGHHCLGFMPDVAHIHEHGETGFGTVIDYDKHFDSVVDGSNDGYGALIEVAARIKQGVSIPVGCVGAMDARMAPDLIDGAIRDGKIDFILTTRSLMADPELPNKLREGRRDECAPCTHCMTCFVAPYDFGTPMYCRVNPALTRAFGADMPEGYDPVPAQESLHVAVVGGGAAGMEAARIAAQRGHRVTLLEAKDHLGGMLSTVATIKGPHEKIAAHEEWLEGQLALRGVEVCLGEAANDDALRALAPDAVVVAVGALEQPPAIPGIEAALTIADLAASAERGEQAPFGQTVVVLGGKFRACELAANLLRQGKRVVMLNEGPAEDFYQGGATWPRLMGKRWLAAKGLKAYHGCTVRDLSRGVAVADTAYGTTVEIPYDTVVLAEDVAPNRELFDAVATWCPNTFAVGDCYSPGTIANATARANIVARNVEKAPDAGTALEGEGVYTARAAGIGDVTVSIRVADGAVTEAAVDTSNETEGIGRNLGEAFAEQIVAKGTIDAVSSATVTSTAVTEALADCLAQAGLA